MMKMRAQEENLCITDKICPLLSTAKARQN